MAKKLHQNPEYNPATESHPKNIFWVNVYDPNTDSFPEDSSRYIEQKNLSVWSVAEVTLGIAELGTLNWSTGFKVLPDLEGAQYYVVDEIRMEYEYDGLLVVDRPYLSFWVNNASWHFISTNWLNYGLANGVVVLRQSPAETSNADEVGYSYLQQMPGLFELYLGNTPGGTITGGGPNTKLRLKIKYRIETFGEGL